MFSSVIDTSTRNCTDYPRKTKMKSWVFVRATKSVSSMVNDGPLCDYLTCHPGSLWFLGCPCDYMIPKFMCSMISLPSFPAVMRMMRCFGAVCVTRDLCRLCWFFTRKNGGMLCKITHRSFYFITLNSSWVLSFISFRKIVLLKVL